jgi:hypothetical protein
MDAHWGVPDALGGGAEEILQTKEEASADA